MASFSNLGADVVVETDGDSVVREHPTTLPLSSDVRRSSATRGEGTPLRERETADRRRKDDLRVIIIGLSIFVGGVAIALFAQLIAGTKQMLPHGALTTPDPRCTQMAVNVLKMDASAVDAAIIASLCVGIVQPQSTGIGGGGLMIIHDHKHHNTTLIDYRPVSVDGKTSIGVPGEIMGLKVAHDRYGKVPWTQLLESAALLADGVIEWSSTDEDDLRQPPHREENAEFTSSFGSRTHGAQLTQPRLADTFRLIAKIGIDEFYRGPIADDIVQTSNGTITKKDLTDYSVQVDYSAVSVSLPDNYRMETFASGTPGSLLAFALSFMALMPKESTDDQSWKDGWMRALKIAKQCEHEATVNNVVNGLLLNVTTSSADELSKLCANGHISKRQPQYASHISVVDNSELLVSVSSSIGSAFGSRRLTRHGFLLNNAFDGMIESGRNERAPTDFAPAVVYNDQRPCQRRFAIGSVGGVESYQSTAQAIASILFRQSLPKDAVHPTIICRAMDDGEVRCDDGAGTTDTGVVSIAMKFEMSISAATTKYRTWQWSDY